MTSNRWRCSCSLAQSARGRPARAPMMGGMGSPGAVALVSSDLMFASQVSTTMRNAGGSSVLVVGDSVPDVDLVFVDLNTAADARLALIHRLRQERPDVEIVGFCHHADREL